MTTAKKLDITNPRLLQTDFYQLTMVTAYIVEDMANDTAGFEAFYRHVKPKVAPHDNSYIFDGGYEITVLFDEIRKELADHGLLEVFIRAIEPRIPEETRQATLAALRKKWSSLRTDFEYWVLPDGAACHPLVPAVQFRGPLWIGQLVETPVCLAINSRTGLATVRHDLMSERRADAPPLFALEALVFGATDQAGTEVLNQYLQHLHKRAKEYRQATDKTLLEAALRRAPSLQLAVDASRIAVEEGWNGSSNVAAWLLSQIPPHAVGGSMAHAYVMAHRDEQQAFADWDRTFPHTTYLVDTYDTIQAVKNIVKAGLRPGNVRIDSGDLPVLAREVRRIFDEAGWHDCGIYISGDLTPKLLAEYTRDGVPFTKAMAGTMFVNDEQCEFLNAGFVYKLVQHEPIHGEVRYPEKKSSNKANHAGLKRVEFVDGELRVSCRGNKTFGYAANVRDAPRDAKTVFLNC